MTSPTTFPLMTNSWQIAAGTIAALTAVWLLGQTIVSRRAKRSFPPGPPGLPLVGNLLDMPNVTEWLVYAEWAKKYGDIVGVRMPGMSIVFLDDEQDVKALFASRSSNYSNRLSMPMLHLSGWEDATASTSIGNLFRTHRRLMTKFLGSQTIKKTAGIQEEFTRAAIIDMIQKDDSVQSHLKWMAAKLLLRLTYGHNVVDRDDGFVHWADVSLQSFLLTSRPDWIVNSLPFLQYLPAWLPGMGFKEIAADSRMKAQRSHDDPLKWVKAQIAAGTAQPSFALDVLSDMDLAVDEDPIRVVLGNLYIAGSDTIIATLSWFLLAMSLFPDAQRRAQAEIDEVIAGERLPHLADRPNLPYLDALLKEIVRWNAVTNIALPHVALADDTYKGFRFEKGTIFMPNVWSILHNPKKYPDPFKFKPERFLDKSNERSVDGVEVNEDPNHFVFGFGMRICPGRHLADSVIWTFAAQILASCNISSARYADGTAITESNIDSTSGFVSCPLPFTSKIVARSRHAQALLFD
ncbi:cytochrome P450 [Auriculariales sp. MPI-PUGE-AT-0066]|nr:cytochrome P450 [Auriculariales sp. MPI-PUGE-AT-0066]